MRPSIKPLRSEQHPAKLLLFACQSGVSSSRAEESRGRSMSLGLEGRRYAARARSRYPILLPCLLLMSVSTSAQTYVRTVEIGVIQDSDAPLSPSQTSPPPLAAPLSNVPPQVVDIYGQPVNFDTGRADMAHRVIVDNFGGGEAGESKAKAARQSAANLTVDVNSLTYRFSRAWDGSSFDAISRTDDPRQTGPAQPAFSTQFFTASAGIASPRQRQTIMNRFDNDPPGGVVLEGIFDPGSLQSVVYDARYHALVFDRASGGRVAYFGIPAQDVVTLCHALAEDDANRVAVSLEHPPRTYGGLASDSNVALNMFVADGLLGAIAFGSLTDTHDMIDDFRLAGDYTTQKPTNDFGAAAVMFTFNSGSYQDDGKSLAPSGNALDVLFVPLAQSGGAYVAAMSGDLPQEFLENGKHITDNLDNYYAQEPIITLIFRYAQTASLLRGLKAEHVDLNQLAHGIAFATGESQ